MEQVIGQSITHQWDQNMVILIWQDNAFGVGSGEMWNYTEPNDHYVNLKGEPNTFGSAGDVIMYCWHNVPDYKNLVFMLGMVIIMEHS